MPGVTAPTAGLSEAEAHAAAQCGGANTPIRGSSRTTATILRTTVFSFYNNVLFVIGIALLGLGRYSDASGSAVTRDVADIVLLDDSFATLPTARTEGRRIVSGVGTSM